MAETTVSIEVPGLGSQRLQLLYLRRYVGARAAGVLNGLDYLQAVRVGVRGGMLEDRYNSLNPSAADRLINEAQHIPFTHVIAPPSRFQFAGEYAAALAKGHKAIDFERSPQRAHACTSRQRRSGYRASASGKLDGF